MEREFLWDPRSKAMSATWSADCIRVCCSVLTKSRPSTDGYHWQPRLPEFQASTVCNLRLDLRARLSTRKSTLAVKLNQQQPERRSVQSPALPQAGARVLRSVQA